MTHLGSVLSGACCLRGSLSRYHYKLSLTRWIQYFQSTSFNIVEFGGLECVEARCLKILKDSGGF